MERFWSKVARCGESDCWEWPGARMKAGYGVIKLRRPRRNESTHRLAWILTHGPIPPGLCVCHRCDNPPCCNPAHLFLGTDADNAKDKIIKGRQVRGELVGTSKLTAQQVDAMRQAYAAGNVKQKELGAHFGVSIAQVSRIVNRIRWAA